MNCTNLLIYLDRIKYNVYLYYKGYLKWNDIENFNVNKKSVIDKNLLTLYKMNPDYYKQNILIHLFNGDKTFNDYSDKNLKNNFKIKVLYYIINNPNVSKNSLDIILKEMRYKNLLSKFESYCLCFFDVDSVTRFDFVFKDKKGLFKDEMDKLETFRTKAEQKFKNLL